MKAHTEIPGLEQLPEQLAKQRQKLAIQIRITTEDRALREEIAKSIPDTVSAVTCVCVVGGREREFEVRPYFSSRDGKRRVKVIPIR